MSGGSSGGGGPVFDADYQRISQLPPEMQRLAMGPGPMTPGAAPEFANALREKYGFGGGGGGSSSGGGGGNGGGGGGKKNNKTTPAAPSNMMLNLPAFMPGNQSSLANQLSMGFGGTPGSFMQSPLMSLFQPMSIPNYPAGAPLVPADPKKKKK